MSQAKSLDPNRYVISYGAIRMQGWAPGDEPFTWEYDEEVFLESEPGMDGEFARSLNANRKAILTLRLTQTSITNIELDEAISADIIAAEAGLGGAGIRPFTVADMQGATRLFSAQSWLMNQPNGGLGKIAGVREWKVRAAHLSGTHGGNVR